MCSQIPVSHEDYQCLMSADPCGSSCACTDHSFLCWGQDNTETKVSVHQEACASDHRAQPSYHQRNQNSQDSADCKTCGAPSRAPNREDPLSKSWPLKLWHAGDGGPWCWPGELHAGLQWVLLQLLWLLSTWKRPPWAEGRQRRRGWFTNLSSVLFGSICFQYIDLLSVLLFVQDPQVKEASVEQLVYRDPQE